MGGKVLRSLVVSGALVAGVGLVGASVASAAVPSGPSGPAVSASAPSSVHGAVAESVNYAVTRTATVDGLRVRMGPGTDSLILGQIYAGEQVQVITSTRVSGGQQWDLIMLQSDSAGGLPGGYVGWVTDAYLY
ncbi:SH3 domain-containing protein [Streptomyces sp. DT2A-34]|uniref:SH3 domain-containing protein n=1 Tax=Streptomyces sp. DT2A-34 TaxID=3051182 RepID=UPI00265BC2BD|nr:SH3 domain-containing protein [Streptomyces sp. DT2A-34]MDO0912109.1 SH3 domain-containing protein [Streptomyces sp. DT2A-34]